MTSPTRTQAVATTRPQQPPAPQSAQAADNGGTEGESPKALDRYAAYGSLSPAARAEVQRAKQLRGVADMIALTPYGEKLSDAGRVAVARWCIARDIDPLTELDNVGGLYPNADYYKRKLGELRVRGIVRDVTQEHIAHDPRLITLAKDKDAPEEEREWAKREHYRRLRLRTEHGVPEEATGACVTAIYLVAGGEPIVGTKWGGGGTSVRQFKSGGGSAPNPIVEGNPVLSVESQSIRRAMMQLAMTHPGMLPGFAGMQEELKELNAEVRAEGAPPFTDSAPPSRSGALTAGQPEWMANDAYTGEPVPQSTGVRDERIASNAAALSAEPDFSGAPSIDTLDLGLGEDRPAHRNAVTEGR